MRYVDWIWHIRGRLPLAAGQSSAEAFDRLEPLFHQPGTSHQRSGETLTFRKKDQAAQDKMSIIDDGVLEIRKDTAGPILHYHLTSRSLLFCFLAPFLFLGFALLTIALGKIEATRDANKSASELTKKADKKKVALPQNWIDKALGAPAPEVPKKDADKKDEPRAPTAAYVFAGIFAVLYVVGRILEDRVIRSLFRKRLGGT